MANKTLIGLLSTMAFMGGVLVTESLEQPITASAATTVYKQSATSQLGELKTINSRIYTAPGSKTSVVASTKYTGEIFYIFKKATLSGKESYYLISRQSNTKAAAIGWVKESSIKRATYKVMTNVKKTRYLKGSGKAYTRPGGLARNVLLSNLSSYKNMAFSNNMTVKVGTKTWYRATVDKKTLWVPSTALSNTKITTVAAPVLTKTAQLARLNSTSVMIRSDVTSSKTATAAGKLTANTFTVLQKATYDKIVYYQLTLQGKVVGWVKQSDVKANTFVAPSALKKTLYHKGTSYGYSQPWGSSADIVTKDVAAWKEQAFHITQQAKVGSSIWYYGAVANGPTVWVAASATTTTVAKPEAPIITATSKMARIKNENTLIYADMTNSKSGELTGDLTANTFTVTSSASYDQIIYYHLLQDGEVVGWVKESELQLNPYEVPTALKKTVYHKGTGYGFSTPWGGVEDRIVSNTATWKNQSFNVTQQAKVATSIWYYGTVANGAAVWIPASATTVTPPPTAEPVYTTQSLQGVLKSTAKLYTSLTTLATKTLTTNEKTEKFTIQRSATVGDKIYYEISRLSNSGKNTVIGWILSTDMTTTKVSAPVTGKTVLYLSGLGNATNIAGGTATGNIVFKDLVSYPATQFTATASQKVGAVTYYLGKVNSKMVWVSEYYFGNPYQYFNLRKISNITQKEMEDYLVSKKGIAIKTNNLYKTIPVFLDMQSKYGINAQFMLAHAIWETGWGGSQISQYKNNFFGYQAFDSCAMTCAMYFPTGTDGIQYYADAIYRKYLQEGAIYNNGVSAAGMNVKYATDKTWAMNIARLMEAMKPYNATYYNGVKASTIEPVIPVFNYSNVIPATASKPTSYHTFEAGITATVTVNTSARKLPYATSLSVLNYTAGTKITLDGTNNDVSSKWMRVIINKQEAWISRSALKITNLGQATTEANIRDLPTTTNSKVLTALVKNQFFKLTVDEAGKVKTEKDSNGTIWYNLTIPGKKTTGWISSTIITVY